MATVALSPCSWEDVKQSQHQAWIKLVELFYHQIRYGCISAVCQTPTCRSYRIRASGRRPYRAPTASAAKHWATILACEPGAESGLCPHDLKPMSSDDGAFIQRSAEEPFDTKSLVQRLFNSDAWHRQKASRLPADVQLCGQSVHELYASLNGRFNQMPRAFQALVDDLIDEFDSNFERERSKAFTNLFEYTIARLDRVTAVLPSNANAASQQKLLDSLVLASALLVAFIGAVPSAQFLAFDQAVSDGPVFSADLCKSFGKDLHRYIEVVENRLANSLGLRIVRCLGYFDLYRRFFNRLCITDGSVSQGPRLVHRKLAVWIKLVFRNSWRSESFEVHQTSDASLSLRFLDRYKGAISSKENPDRSFPGNLGFLARNVDIVKDIMSWMKPIDTNGPVHLLNYTWAFDLRDRLVMFRSANYFLMLSAFEKAMEVSQMVIRTQGTVREAASAQSRHHQVLERVKPALTAYLVLQIRRDNILEDALSQLWRREQRELRRPLKIKMGMDMGEEGIDLGGVQQEFFRLAIAKALDPDLGFFDVDPVTRMAWFRPFSPAPLIQFALVGMLFGLAVFNSITLPITFPEFFYRLLLQNPESVRKSVRLSDIADGWPVVHRSLKALIEYEGDDVADVFALDFTFAVELTGKRIALDMRGERKPSTAQEAISSNEQQSGFEDVESVTNENREEYVRCYLAWLLDKSVWQQTDAFLRGFHSVIVGRTLGLFQDGSELKDAVEGTQEISVAALKQITKYTDGYTADMRIVSDFWEVVEGYNQDQLRRLLEFVTASERVPAAGIQDLAFIIQKNGQDDERLPTSMTCFGRLLMPHYSSKEVLKDRLGVALENCEGFGVA